MVIFHIWPQLTFLRKCSHFVPQGGPNWPFKENAHISCLTGDPNWLTKRLRLQRKSPQIQRTCPLQKGAAGNYIPFLQKSDGGQFFTDQVRPALGSVVCSVGRDHRPQNPIGSMRSPVVPYKSSENPSNVTVDSMGHLGNFPLTPSDNTGIPLYLGDPQDVPLATWNTPDVPLDPLGRPWTWTRGQLKTRDVA